jgi:hypothetical protein
MTPPASAVKSKRCCRQTLVILGPSLVAELTCKKYRPGPKSRADSTARAMRGNHSVTSKQPASSPSIRWVSRKRTDGIRVGDSTRPGIDNL